jgi:hypothetical protein
MTWSQNMQVSFSRHKVAGFGLLNALFFILAISWVFLDFFSRIYVDSVQADSEFSKEKLPVFPHLGMSEKDSKKLELIYERYNKGDDEADLQSSQNPEEQAARAMQIFIDDKALSLKAIIKLSNPATDKKSYVLLKILDTKSGNIEYKQIDEGNELLGYQLKIVNNTQATLTEKQTAGSATGESGKVIALTMYKSNKEQAMLQTVGKK